MGREQAGGWDDGRPGGGRKSEPRSLRSEATRTTQPYTTILCRSS